MPRLPRVRPHAYIAAMGRSGSTVLANLFHDPPERVMLLEPNLLEPEPTGECRLQLTDSLGPGATIETLGETERWGIKEVRADLHGPAIDRLDPAHIVVLLRDPVAASISLHEKGERDGDLARLAWLEARMTDPLRVLPRIAERHNAIVVAYERLVADADARAALADRLGWPMTGDLNRGLTRYGRAREIDLHRGAITTASLARSLDNAAPQARAFVERVTRGADEARALHDAAANAADGFLCHTASRRTA
ncbi:MAG: hypothetical protein AAGF47_05255 [Planctomycetota bacterium]